MIVHLQCSSASDPCSRRPVLLCVDDARSALLARAHVLSSHGYEVIATDSAEEALCALWEYPVNAIVTDYEMPGMNGAQFAAHVKRGSWACPILLHSGCTEIPPSALRYMDAFVAKGQSVSHFLREVDSFIARLGGGLANGTHDAGHAV
jgi:response regulator RpfG family c-di-GMP phosphodiesterase